MSREGHFSPPAWRELNAVLVMVPPDWPGCLRLSPQSGPLLGLLVRVLQLQRLHLPAHVVLRPVSGHHYVIKSSPTVSIYFLSLNLDKTQLRGLDKLLFKGLILILSGSQNKLMDLFWEGSNLTKTFSISYLNYDK